VRETEDKTLEKSAGRSHGGLDETILRWRARKRSCNTIMMHALEEDAAEYSGQVSAGQAGG